MTVDNSKAITKEVQDSITPAMAIEMLKEGNKRFLNKTPLSRNHSEHIAATSGGQWPFAAILGCIDSRVPSEIVFDQGIGDLFNARVAGNFVNTDIIGSIEYACKVAGSKAVVVMGHSHCGAVKGACDNVELGNITHLLSNIKPAIEAVTDVTENRTSSNGDFVAKVIDKNVVLTIEEMRKQSPVLKEMEDNGEIVIVGAVYDVESGEVTFM